jgi:hypothetical protein
LGELIAISWRMLRAHPVVLAALGGAVVLSLASTVFGIGVLVTPWFVCEIFALQLAILTDRPSARSAAWLRAGVLVLGMVGLVLVLTWLAALAIGPDIATADAASGPLPWPEALRRVALIAAVTALTVGFIAPFQYAPLIAIERGSRIGEAVLESAWLVRRGGLARHWALAFLAHLLPLAPALIAAIAVARTYERAATPLGFLVGLPLVPLSIPFGQGLLTAAYAARRHRLAERRWTRAEGAPPLLLRMMLIASVLAPFAAVLCLVASVLRPSAPAIGRAQGDPIVERQLVRSEVVYVPDTTLEVRVDGRAVEIRSGDGGGSTLANPPWRHPIDRVRVAWRRDVYAVELGSRGRSWVTFVDRAGVRVEDTIATRLFGRAKPWALASIAFAFGLSALLLVRALEPLGAIRREYGAPADERAPLSTLRARRKDALRRAWTVASILVVPSLLALAGGLSALFA